MLLSRLIRVLVCISICSHAAITCASDIDDAKASFKSRFPNTEKIEKATSGPIKGWFQFLIQNEDGKSFDIYYHPAENMLFFGRIKSFPDIAVPPKRIMEDTGLEGIYSIKIPGLEGQFLYSASSNLWLVGEIWKDGELYLSGVPQNEKQADTPELTELYD